MLLQEESGQNRINIAIDGPAGAGKSTVARLVAQQLGYVYVDTGAMYRAVTWKVLQAGIDLEQTEAIIEITRATAISLLPGADRQIVIIDGEDRTEEIRSIEVNRGVSRIAKIEQVRSILVSVQKRMALDKGIVMDGRDIGTHVLPDAEVKIYLTASVRKRAERRFIEWDDRSSLTLEQLEREIEARDRMDEQRAISPLVCAHDAIRIDSTDMTIDDVVGSIVRISRTILHGET